MSILADEQKVRTMLDRAFFLGQDVQRKLGYGTTTLGREAFQANFDKYIEELKTA